MGLLGAALRQLEVRPAESAVLPTTNDAPVAFGEHTTADSPDATAGFEPLAVDYADVLAADVFAQVEVAGPASAEVLAEPQLASSDRSIEEILDFTETAIQAAAAETEELSTDHVSVTYDIDGSKTAALEPPTAELAPGGNAEHKAIDGSAHADWLSSMPIDRAYARLWDNLSASLGAAPPWSIVALSPDRSSSTTWMLPAAAACGQRYAGRSLLIDASRNVGRHASLAELFGSTAEYGLTDVLRRVVGVREAVRKTAVPGVELLSRGIGNSNPVFPTNRYADVFAELKSEYRLILIHADDPDDSHVLPIFSVADGTLLVIELGRTERAAAEIASNAIYLAGARLLGCIARS